MHQPVGALLRTGGAIVYTTPQTPVAAACSKMVAHNVGAILVLDAHSDIAGIFTERDLLRRVVVPGLDPKKTPIAEVMTPEVVAVSHQTPRSEVLQIMGDRHIRHIPILRDNRIIGIISLRDLLRFANQQKDFEITQLKSYVLGGTG